MIDEDKRVRQMLKRVAETVDADVSKTSATGSPLFSNLPHISIPDMMERIVALEARIQNLELLHSGER